MCSRPFEKCLPHSDHLLMVFGMVSVREIEPGDVHSLINKHSRVVRVLGLGPR